MPQSHWAARSTWALPARSPHALWPWWSPPRLAWLPRCMLLSPSPGEAEVTWLKSHGANLVEAPGWFSTAGLAWGVFASPSCSWGGISTLWRRNQTRLPPTSPALRTFMPRIFFPFCSGATFGAFWWEVAARAKGTAPSTWGGKA